MRTPNDYKDYIRWFHYYIYDCIYSYACCFVFNYQQEQAPLPGWTTQSNVPNCIVSHFTFGQFNLKDVEDYQMSCYLLNVFCEMGLF